MPDSLNYEQLSMTLKIRDYVWANMTVKNNMQRLLVTRRRLKKAGIPTVYYDILRYDTHTTNSFVKRALKEGTLPAEVLDMEKLIAEAKTRWFETERQEMLDRLEDLKRTGGKVKRIKTASVADADASGRSRYDAPSLPVVDPLSPVVAAPASVSVVSTEGVVPQ